MGTTLPEHTIVDAEVRAFQTNECASTRIATFPAGARRWGGILRPPVRWPPHPERCAADHNTCGKSPGYRGSGFLEQQSHGIEMRFMTFD